MEMQGRDDDGIAWYAGRRRDWAEECFFAVHNWWHWALYHVDRDEPGAALALYDEGLAPNRRSITLNLCDATALLWRLALAGRATDDRFRALADAFDAPARQSVRVFNDVHAMLTFVGAGRLGRAAEHLADHETRALGGNGHAVMLRRLGAPAARACSLLALGDGRKRPPGFDAKRSLSELSGSSAQRDVLTMTQIEAAIRAGERSLARARLEERQAAKPNSERRRRDLARCW